LAVTELLVLALEVAVVIAFAVLHANAPTHSSP
jgi:hypothetical protein